MKSRYAVERRQPCQIIRADDQLPLMAQTRSAGMSAMPPLLGDKRTSRGEPISVAIDPGCVKTRRRSIAIEQVTRSRPFHVPTSEAHSILKSKSRISFSSRFELLSFHTAWVINGPRRPRNPTSLPEADIATLATRDREVSVLLRRIVCLARNAHRQFALPRPAALNFEYQRPAQKGADQNQPSQKTQTCKGKLDRYRPYDVGGDKYFKAQQQGAADPYLVLIILLRIGTPMDTEISRPDNTGDDDEDAENFDADANDMNPATYICLESRDALDISAHRSKIHRLQARLTQ